MHCLSSEDLKGRRLNSLYLTAYAESWCCQVGNVRDRGWQRPKQTEQQTGKDILQDGDRVQAEVKAGHMTVQRKDGKKVLEAGSSRFSACSFIRYLRRLRQTQPTTAWSIFRASAEVWLMLKLSSTFRYMLTVFLASAFYLTVAYFVLRPLEWRAHLLNLFSQSFGLFTAIYCNSILKRIRLGAQYHCFISLYDYFYPYARRTRPGDACHEATLGRDSSYSDFDFDWTDSSFVRSDIFEKFD
jgi:hypothetical protein